MNLEIPEIPLTSQLPVTPPDSFPAFLRAPRAGSKCPVSGLNRTALDKLVRPQPENNFRPPVRSRILKAKGATRGIRLIDTRSLLDHLQSLPDGAEVSDAD
jgi:hypothetical protein